MVVRTGSVLLLAMPVSSNQAEMGDRSAQQVTERLDGLIKKIYTIQGPCMHGEKAADVILVRLRHWCRHSICGHNLDMLQ